MRVWGRNPHAHFPYSSHRSQFHTEVSTKCTPANKNSD